MPGRSSGRSKVIIGIISCRRVAAPRAAFHAYYERRCLDPTRSAEISPRIFVRRARAAGDRTRWRAAFVLVRGLSVARVGSDLALQRWPVFFSASSPANQIRRTPIHFSSRRSFRQARRRCWRGGSACLVARALTRARYRAGRYPAGLAVAGSLVYGTHFGRSPRSRHRPQMRLTVAEVGPLRNTRPRHTLERRIVCECPISL
jgi:hypothetical protein